MTSGLDGRMVDGRMAAQKWQNGIVCKKPQKFFSAVAIGTPGQPVRA